MPNYCQNKLIIRGKNKDIASFVSSYLALQGGFSFNSFIPEPTSKSECPSAYLIVDKNDANVRRLVYGEDYPKNWFDWYSWHCDKWGTKWDVCSCNYNVSKNYNLVTIWFDTAWSPSVPVVEKMIEMFPNLNITYYYFEAGSFFGGGYNDRDGWYEVSEKDLSKFASNKGFGRYI